MLKKRLQIWQKQLKNAISFVVKCRFFVKSIDKKSPFGV